MTGSELWVPYCGAAPAPAELVGRWNLDLVLIILLTGLTLCGARLRDSKQRTMAFVASGVAVLLFVSPLCALTSALFAARSVHHLALTTLLAASIAWALPNHLVRRPPGGLLVWTAVSAFVLWFWHAPTLYAASYANNLVYWTMQASLLGSAALFWIAARVSDPVSASVALLSSMVQMGLLGALLAFGNTPFYAPHWSTTLSYGLTPLADQQLGGLIMWVGGGGLYLALALTRMRRVLKDEQMPLPA